MNTTRYRNTQNENALFFNQSMMLIRSRPLNLPINYEQEHFLLLAFVVQPERNKCFLKKHSYSQSNTIIIQKPSRQMVQAKTHQEELN